RQRTLELLLGGAVELLEGLGALEEKVHVELPGEADAAVHLDGLPADEARRIAGPGLRRGAGERDVRIARVHAPGRAVDRGARRLDAQEHVGQPVLERLEGADRTVERGARVHVGERGLEAAL